MYRSTEHDEKLPQVREALSRSQRLARRFKNVLCCEWCNKWTEVSAKRWQKLKIEEKLFPRKYVFYCPRPQCKAGRAEYFEEVLPS